MDDLFYSMQSEMRETQIVFVRIISLKYFQASDSLHCTYGLIHFMRTAENAAPWTIRDWQSINRHYPTILTIRRANLPVPVCHSPCKILRQFFFFSSRSSRHVPFSRRDRISCISALFTSTVVANSFLQQSNFWQTTFSQKNSKLFWTFPDSH